MDRTTIMIHPKVTKKVRELQAHLLVKKGRSVSFSEVINQIISDVYHLKIQYKEEKK